VRAIAWDPGVRLAMLSSMRSLLPGILVLAIFVVALLRLPPLHPIQIWSGSWTLSLTMYALKLLPYRSLSWLTVALICGGTVSFSVAVLAGEWGGRRTFLRDARPQSRNPPTAAIRLAACASLLAGAVLLAVFLAQVTQRYGLASMIRVSETVRMALVSGSAPKSFVYSEFAIVAAALCSLTATRTVDRASRRRWLLASACAVGSLYFSTSRQLVADALIIAVIVFLFARGGPIMRRRLIGITAGLALLTLVIFLGVGALIGNTYHTNDASQFDNFFSRNPAISWLAPAYVDASAPVPALDIAVRFSGTWGRSHGCATAPFECRMLRRAGLDVEQQPLAPAFTQTPLPWNAYTFLGTLLKDGGTALVLILVALCGLFLGIIWSLHRSGSTYGTLLYVFVVPALVWAYRQNLLDVEVDAAILAIGLTWVTSRVCQSSRLERLFRLKVVTPRSGHTD
jgi:oligosaccharide repeat unit polymerase